MLPSEAFTSPCSSVTHHHTSPRATTVLRAEEGSKERKPWDVLRFVSQSSKFVTPPPIPFIGGPRNGGTRKIGPGAFFRV